MLVGQVSLLLGQNDAVALDESVVLVADELPKHRGRDRHG